MVHSSHLRKITVYLDDTPPLLTLQHFLRRLSAIRSHVVDHLEISDAHNSRVDPYIITPHDLEPLLSFKNLRHLSIDLHAIIAVDNAWLKVAVSTWPRLHHGGTGSISTKDALEEMRRMSCLEM